MDTWRLFTFGPEADIKLSGAPAMRARIGRGAKPSDRASIEVGRCSTQTDSLFGLLVNGTDRQYAALLRVGEHHRRDPIDNRSGNIRSIAQRASMYEYQ
jgi:hypothetical protein